MRRTPILFLLGLFLLILSDQTPALAQTDKIDEYVKAELVRQKIPGLAVAVVQKGEIIKAKGYGLANVELKVPATPDTIFQSGSVGKQFTATLVMMLVEEGKIQLDDPIEKYLGEVPKSWKPITVRHLLTHTGGLTDYPEDFDFRRDYTEAELLKRAQAIPVAFAPGEKWQYSNIGYLTLGVLIGKVTGKFYGDVLQERIFKPLGMSTARIISEEDIVPNRAAGYRLEKEGLKNQEWVSPTVNTTADGALYLTVLDMAKWDAALYTEKLLKRASFEQLWTRVKLNSGKTQPYGFGWFLGEVNGHPIVEHGGAWQGFTCHIARYVDDQLTVIVMTNRAGARPTKMAHDIAALYNAGLAPPERKAMQVDPKLFDSYVGEYQLAPEFALTVSREGSTFWIQGTGQPRAELFAESETKFFLKVVNAQVTFVRDSGGKVTQLVLHQNGDHEAKKVK